ncbi:uncharacterized protein CLUP02_09033 [Colletotrichum lupini]|uniref:Uncharacterized protein n=1 Tax=Colletotrichum lupini TaxID=145971 RepID=A0A9Q8SU03_9PEZI|nr:uncharacterized protein CLUP02_09033 [Colletotrichum lupini]UQC83539.1 hypothetical protein CLUP02_09033 [Colletotrichum lupini]
MAQLGTCVALTYTSYHLNRVEYYRHAILNSMVKKRSKSKGTKTTSAHRANGITAPCTSTHVPVLLMPVPTDDPGGDGEWSTESKSMMQEQEQPRKAKGLRTLCKTEKRQVAHGSEGVDPWSPIIEIQCCRSLRLKGWPLAARPLYLGTGGMLRDNMLSPSSSNLMPQMVSPYASVIPKSGTWGPQGLRTLLKVHGSVTQDTAATGHCRSLGFSWAIPPSHRSWANTQSEWSSVSRLFAIFLTPEGLDSQPTLFNSIVLHY